MSLIGILMLGGFIYMTIDLLAMTNENYKKRQQGEK